jgi:hypothetical protein
MLKGNLSSRPFYNERLVAMVVLGAALLGVVLTIFNITALSRLSGERAKQQAEEQQSLSEADRVRQSAQKLQQSLDQSNLRILAEATREANWLIDQRTFSWTEFLGFIEKTLPRDARLVAVAPRVERNVFKIVMLVNAKQQGDLETFIESLESTAAFKNVLPTDMTRLEDGTLSITLESTYVADVLPSSKRSGKGVRP